jgi:hypothetical protein
LKKKFQLDSIEVDGVGEGMKVLRVTSTEEAWQRLDQNTILGEVLKSIRTVPLGGRPMLSTA